VTRDEIRLRARLRKAEDLLRRHVYHRGVVDLTRDFAPGSMGALLKATVAFLEASPIRVQGRVRGEA
jgi:hypothetical protein